MNYWFLFCFFFTLNLSGESFSPQTTSSGAMADLEGEPSAMVLDCVNVITGDYLESSVDLELPEGQDSLCLQRYYASSCGDLVKLHEDRWNDDETAYGNLAIGWNINHTGFLHEQVYITYIDTDQGGRTGRDRFDRVRNIRGEILPIPIAARDREHVDNRYVPVYKYTYTFCNHLGTHLYYTRKQNNFSIDKQIFHFGVTNCGNGEISAKTNLKNVKISYDGKEYKGKDGGGTEYLFTKQKNYHETRKLSSIKLPSGNSINYIYNKYLDLQWITIKDSNQKEIGAIQLKDLKVDKGLKFSYTSSEGRSVSYTVSQQNRKKPYRLEVTTNYSPTSVYTYCKNDEKHHSKVIRRELPEKRIRVIDYYQQKVKGGAREGYVSRVLEPVGNTDEPLTVARFTYDYSNGKTTVWDALEHKSIYHNKQDRLNQIERYLSNNTLYSKEKLLWGKEFNTHLIGRSLEDGKG